MLDKNDISNYIIASYDIECDSSHGDFPLAIKNMKKLAMDIYNIYFHKELYEIYKTVDWTEKSELIKNIIDHAFNGNNEIILEMIKIYYIEVNRIYTTNGKPTQKSIDNLVTVGKPFIEQLDNIKDYNKCRERVINIITDEHLIELKNKKTITIIVKGDEIIQNGTVFYNYGTGEINRNIVVIKPDDKDDEIFDNLENIEIIKCNSEKELLLEWCN